MKKSFLALSLALAMLVGSSTMLLTGNANACGWFSSCNDGSDNKEAEQANVAANQRKMESAVPIPNLENSLERKNISKRLTTFNDPNKVSYIYLVSYGKVMSFYTVKGKVTSGNKRLTASDQIVDSPRYSSDNVVDSPELDGTYGQSSPYIFFWTTDGAYIQWSGDYMLADQPLQLTTTPEITRSIQ